MILLRATLLLLVVMALGCEGKSGSAVLVLPSDVLDFGLLTDDRKVFEIEIRNDGNGPLEIYDVSTSCACSIAEVPRVISPGVSEVLRIKPPNVSQGPNSSKVLLNSNDPTGPHEFHVSWFGKSPLQLAPKRIVVHDAVPGSEIERRFQATYSGGDPLYALTVKSIKVSNPDIKVEQISDDMLAKQSSSLVMNEKTIVGETTFLMRFSVPNDIRTFNETVTVTATQAGEEYSLTLPVSISVVGQLYATGRFFFSARHKDDIVGKAQRVVLTSRQRGANPIVVDCPTFVRHEIRKIADTEANELYEVTAKVVGVPNKDESEWALRLELDGIANSSVAIPINIATLSD